MKLYCIRLTPIRSKLSGFKVGRDTYFFNDERTASFVTSRQRLVVFRSKKAATDWIKTHKCSNEFWRATVSEVRMIDDETGSTAGS